MRRPAAMSSGAAAVSCARSVERPHAPADTTTSTATVTKCRLDIPTILAERAWQRADRGHVGVFRRAGRQPRMGILARRPPDARTPLRPRLEPDDAGARTPGG